MTKRRRRHKANLAAPTSVKMQVATEPLTIELAEGENAGPPKFSALAYSGSVVPGNTATPRLDAPYIINLAGMSASRSPKVNLDHDRKQRVGQIGEFANDGKAVHVSGDLSAATAHRDEVVNSAVGGYQWEGSIEADLSKPRKLAKGKTETINGREVSGPLYIFEQSVLTGLAFVSRGADDGNSISIAAGAVEEPTMNEFEKFAASLGVDLETASDDQKANLQELFDAKQGGGVTTTTKLGNHKSIREIADEQRKENDRQSAIAQLSNEAMKDFPMFIDQIAKLGEAAVETGATPNEYELELIRATRSKAGRFASQMSDTQSDPSVIEAAICLSAGLDVEKLFPARILEAVDRTGLRQGFSLQQVMLQVAHANGYTCRAGERIHNGNIRTVLEYCFPPVHARLSGFSTTSLPGILGNVANKMILAGYMEEDATWREIAKVKNVSTFHQHTHYRMLDDLEYEEVGSGGELKHGSLGEESYTSQAKTYGKMLGLTRTQIINDDLGAFDDIRERLGRGASKKFNNVFWAAFLNNASLFPTDDSLGNYLSGATSTLLVDGVGLQLGITKYRKLSTVTADGEKRVGVSTRPTLLLVPPELEFAAEKLFISTNVNTGGAATAESVPNDNIHARKYKPVIQNRLSDSAFTGYSTTAWYLFGNDLKPMVVTFLNGMQTPTVESTDADFGTLGIQFRGYHDFGCDRAEYLAGIKSKGAS